jgi:hypothetical protein
MANIRKQKNFIHSLQLGDTIALSQSQKHKAIHDHFLDHIGSHVPGTYRLNLSDLGWHPRNMQHLEFPFSEDEVKEVIFVALKEKAPSPYGFVCLFFSIYWHIIKEDILRALLQFYMFNQ